MKIHVDGIEYEATAGRNLLETCLSHGLDLPYFCWHPALGSVGACRQCAVVQYQDEDAEQAGRGRLVMSCMTPVSDGARFAVADDRAQRFRRGIIEALMTNHPHDCPVCAEGGECHLQDMTVMVGHRNRRYRGRKRTFRNQYLGPLVHHEMNRCITCYRCTRFYRDYAGGTDLAAQACNNHIYFGRHRDGVLENEFAGNLVEVCPTGVFTDRLLVHDYTRKWDLQSAPSVCAACAVGCNTLPGERYGRLKRVHNRFNAEVNAYFLCDRGRYGAGYVNDARKLEYPGLRGADGRYTAIGHHEALREFSRSIESGRVAAVGSPRSSVEANFLLRLLTGPELFCPGLASAGQALVWEALALLQSSAASIPDIRTMERADAVLILGEDVSNTAPRVALAVRQSLRNRGLALAGELDLLRWQDAAVRNLTQDRRSPLFLASPAATRLDPVARRCFRLAPRDITRLGLAVAGALRGAPSGEVAPGEEMLAREAGDIVASLQDAQRLLVISGTGCGDPGPMRAAAQIAAAFQETGRASLLSLVVPEANSLGQALLCGPQLPPTLEQLAARAETGAIDTLVVMENDLFLRAPEATVQTLLQACRRVIVLDGMDNATSSASHLALPAASVIESEGTLVSMEGRAQRHFQVFQPAAERRPAWVWLLATLKELGRPEVDAWQHFDDVTRGCAAAVPALAAITDAAPDHNYRNHGLRVPRQPLRYSGRTAMRAHLSIHEPQAPEDGESPLGFTMEGLNRDQPGALLPFVWAPGWNSNQSLHRFQQEAGGPLRGGTAGVRLLGGERRTEVPPAEVPPAEVTPAEVRTAEVRSTARAGTDHAAGGHYLLVPCQYLFGSEPLSAMSPGISELVAPACITLCANDAANLGLVDGDGVLVGEHTGPFPVRIDDSLVPGCAGFSAGYRETAGLEANTPAPLRRAPLPENAGSQVIGSDRGGPT